MKKIENTFLVKHKDEINEINQMFDELMQDKKIKRIYNSYVNEKTEICKFNYNKLDRIGTYQKEVLNGKFCIDKNETLDYNSGLKANFC